MARSANDMSSRLTRVQLQATGSELWPGQARMLGSISVVCVQCCRGMQSPCKLAVTLHVWSLMSICSCAERPAAGLAPLKARWRALSRSRSGVHRGATSIARPTSTLMPRSSAEPKPAATHKKRRGAGKISRKLIFAEFGHQTLVHTVSVYPEAL